MNKALPILGLVGAAVMYSGIRDMGRRTGPQRLGAGRLRSGSVRHDAVTTPRARAAQVRTIQEALNELRSAVRARIPDATPFPPLAEDGQWGDATSYAFVVMANSLARLDQMLPAVSGLTVTVPAHLPPSDSDLANISPERFAAIAARVAAAPATLGWGLANLLHHQ